MFHSAKALVRAKSTATAFVHGGLGNTILSFTEDLVAGVLVLLTVWFPWLALIAAFVLLAGAIGVIYLAIKTGKRIFCFFRQKDELSSEYPVSTDSQTWPGKE